MSLVRVATTPRGDEHSRVTIPSLLNIKKEGNISLTVGKLHLEPLQDL